MSESDEEVTIRLTTGPGGLREAMGDNPQEWPRMTEPDPADLPELSNRLTFKWPDEPYTTMTDEAITGLVGQETTFRVGNVTVPALIVATERYADASGTGVLVTLQSAEPEETP